ncbi:MAG: transglutaminase-like domain-containing protein [Bacteroidota bacterium]
MNALTEKEIVEIKSLVSLLDDEEESIYVTARERLLMYSENALGYIPLLDENTGIAAQRFNEVRELILRSTIKEQFRALKRKTQGDIDLEVGMFLIAKYRYTTLDPKQYTEQLNAYAAELKEKLTSVNDETEIFHRVIKFFVEEKGFTGNKNDYYSEENHYLNRVLETKIGIPITISAVYLLVGKRINLPMNGIGLPGHFVMRFSFGNTHVYFDPFNGGKTLSPADCQEIVKNLGYNFTEEYLKPVSNQQILERMLRNLILMLERRQEKERIETVRQFIDTLNSDL